ncbi:MAG: GGDEF domain-containing protein [Bacilli bacterium]|nr:GGDEF domain-containing protein [Bacilli bacterium]
MEFFYSYFINYFYLLCIVIVLTIICIQKLHEHKRLSISVFTIMGCTVLLSLSDSLKIYFQETLKTGIFWITFFACLSYVVRPACLLLFILLSENRRKSKWFYVLLVPMAICVIIYILPLIPGCEDLVFSYHYNELGGISWKGADNPLRFTSHIVAAIYLGYLVYRSIATLQAKHFSHSLSILFCAAIIVVAVVIETFFNEKGNINLLTTTIAICVVFYYLFLYAEHMQYSVLTGLLNRTAYFADIRKMGKEVTGVIQVDMNGLKYWNDTFGHLEGDLALKTISDILRRSCTRRMYAYRLGGDEFTILAVKESEEALIETIHRIKDGLAKSKYRCSIGSSYRRDNETTFGALVKEAEKRMYEDKSEFYKNSKIERRRTLNPTDN